MESLSEYKKAMEYEIMKYKLTSDALSIALWDMDIVVEDPISPNNKFTWSKEFREMLGFKSEKDFPNLLSSWSDRLHPDDKERTLEAFAAHITDITGKTPYDIKYQLLMKKGSYRHFHAYGNTLRDASGTPLRVAGALMDITEKIDMEEALQISLEETKKASNAKSEFLANMSHEMRTPLNAIIGLSSLCLENNEVDRETYQNLEKVHKAGATLLEMVNDILDISQVAELDSFRSFDDRKDKYVKPHRVSLPYAHVLVVDDNLTNLDVAKGLMKPYKMKIDCVDSGQKAVDAMRADLHKYNAIFMDQMMPGLDGIEAVRQIRELGSDYAKNIPVIALTANAVAGSEEMFLNNGFQAFLTKPIDIPKLDAVINQWIRDENKDRLYEDADTSEENKAGNESILSGKKINGLDIKKGIRQFGGDEDSYIRVLHSYAINTRAILASLRSISENRIHDYEITVHGIKGSSASICANDLAAFAKSLEKAAKAKDWEFISQHTQEFIETAQKLIADLDTLFSEIDADNPKPVKDKPDEDVLEKLKKACDAYDMDGVDAALDDIMQYAYEKDDGLAFWLKENVEQMNFSEIVDRLSKR